MQTFIDRFVTFMEANASTKREDIVTSVLLGKTLLLMEGVRGAALIDCKEYDRLYDYMTHDKKNLSAGQVNFTLLSDVGDIHIDQIASKDEIFEALDFYRDSMGC